MSLVSEYTKRKEEKFYIFPWFERHLLKWQKLIKSNEIEKTLSCLKKKQKFTSYLFSGVIGKER